MIKFFTALCLLILPSIAIADPITVTRYANNLYKGIYVNKYIETHGCNIDVTADNADMTLSGTSGSITFSTTDSCIVLEVFEKWGPSVPLSNSTVNVSYDNTNWYTLNNLITYEDNGKKLEMTGCSESPSQQPGRITATTAGVGSLDLLDPYDNVESSCDFSAIYERTFTGTVGPDADADGVPDSSDAFPNDPAASVDTDGDGYPDYWNDGYSQADSTTGLALDADPFNSDIYLIGSFLYFPHIDSASGGSDWETEIGILNSGNAQLEGTLYAYDNSGTQVETKAVTVPVDGRVVYTVGDDFSQHTQIGYMKFIATASLASGYEKFYRPEYRVAIPAVSIINSRNLNVSHIDSSSDWWTGVALVNTNTAEKTVTFTFSDDSTYELTLAAGQHWAGTIGSLSGITGANVSSAEISDAEGIIGLELFGGYTNNYLSGILLNDQTASSLYYPHVASDSTWWTGIVGYNPGVVTATLTITSYDTNGSQLGTSELPIPSKGKYIGIASSLGLPEGTAWFKLDTNTPISGFELFGTYDGYQLAGYTSVNIQRSDGLFAKIDHEGWTGIAFVNTSSSTANVDLDALDNSGNVIDTASVSLAANAKIVNLAEGLFSGDISSATFIKFSSDQDVVGFQLNGSSTEDRMLDGLPGI